MLVLLREHPLSTNIFRIRQYNSRGNFPKNSPEIACSLNPWTKVFTGSRQPLPKRFVNRYFPLSMSFHKIVNELTLHFTLTEKACQARRYLRCQASELDYLYFARDTEQQAQREGISDAKHRSLTIYISRATLSNKPGGLATLIPQC